MHHFTWALAWFVVGLTVTLVAASVLQNFVPAHPSAAQPVAANQGAPMQQDNAKTTAGEQRRDLVVAWRHAGRTH
jgi:hypothetical protein